MSITITNDGKEMLRNAVLNGEKISFGKLELIANQEKSPSAMHLEVNVSSVEAGSEDGTVIIRAMVKNDGFAETYYFNRVNVLVGDVVFAYEDSCDICIPPETIKTINALDIYLKIDAAQSEMTIEYGSYVLKKDFDDLKGRVKDLEEKTDMEDITDKVTWNENCTECKLYRIGDAVFLHTKYQTNNGFNTDICRIPDAYRPAKDTDICTHIGRNEDIGKVTRARISSKVGTIVVEVVDISSGDCVGTTLPTTISGFWFIG